MDPPYLDYDRYLESLDADSLRRIDSQRTVTRLDGGRASIVEGDTSPDVLMELEARGLVEGRPVDVRYQRNGPGVFWDGEYEWRLTAAGRAALT